MANIVIAALYKFAKLHDYREMQNGLLDFCIAQGLNGTILLAAEGINGTVASKIVPLIPCATQKSNKPFCISR